MVKAGGMTPECILACVLDGGVHFYSQPKWCLNPIALLLLARFSTLCVSQCKMDMVRIIEMMEFYATIDKSFMISGKFSIIPRIHYYDLSPLPYVGDGEIAHVT